MTTPYLIVSDIHCHSWSQFATTNEDGVNSRLRIILDELERVADILKSKGGCTMIIAGDLFHVRGSIKPSVMNPVLQCFENIRDKVVDIHAIAGNHDLEGTNADVLGNAMEALSFLDEFYAYTGPGLTRSRHQTIRLLPWYQKLDDLREQIAKHANPEHDLVIHAPVDGVIKGLPDHGLTPEELADFGYKRVFSGHYHNYVDFGNGVYSCGATTHQTWSDPGTTAGALLVYPDRVEHIPTQAPLFVDLKDPDEITERVIRGNYVRLKLADVTEAEIKLFRKELEDMGALGVNIQATKKATGTRNTNVKAGASLEVSVNDYIRDDLRPPRMKRVQQIASEILGEIS